ncbi:DUF6491 family protein [Pseudoxanthomonas japonensis]|uniref:Lipoprotein n=1 Tax=Pseudoxanthomonas japonensis TaxID=69284 RepID=A0ABQ6ZD05_9GAMM|nr:DUF6491 family protein [Pseudoxanthomonas japonensis]KAF1722205.1 hypothetical protein CSC78_17460 [Pseudoxanthomonas japonensis]MCR6626746.1 DUF6491 family protein [Pseudoxanthomonas sp.]
MKPLLPFALLAAAALSGCATDGKQTDAEKLAFYRDHAGEPVKDFQYFGRLNGWTPLGDGALAVWTRPSEGYLLELTGPCQDLDYAMSISVTQFGNRVSARFDDVVPLGAGTSSIKIPCRIETIRPLDVKALRASEKEMREAALEERKSTP